MKVKSLITCLKCQWWEQLRRLWPHTSLLVDTGPLIITQPIISYSQRKAQGLSDIQDPTIRSQIYLSSFITHISLKWIPYYISLLITSLNPVRDISVCTTQLHHPPLIEWSLFPLTESFLPVHNLLNIQILAQTVSTVKLSQGAKVHRTVYFLSNLVAFIVHSGSYSSNDSSTHLPFYWALY